VKGIKKAFKKLPILFWMGGHVSVQKTKLNNWWN